MPDTTEMIYSVFPLMYPEFVLDNDTVCFDGNSIDVSAGGVFQSETSMLWEFGENTSIELSFEQTVQDLEFYSPGIFPISLTFSGNGCVKTFTDSIAVYPNPMALFSISDTDGCMPFEVQFFDMSSAITPLSYSWSFGDGNLSENVSPSNIFLESGNYFVELEVATTSGCIDQDIYQFPLPIEVYPLPVADFNISPAGVRIENPLVEVSNNSVGDIDVLYVIGDLDTLFEENFDYVFEEVGNFRITQVVYNEFGCQDTAIKYVKVNGLLFYMPNAFTPNNDGVNDFLFPYVKGVDYFHINIYNRWGEVIFESFNVDQAWDGSGVMEGVYNYVVILSDFTGIRYRYVGSITLLR